MRPLSRGARFVVTRLIVVLASGVLPAQQLSPDEVNAGTVPYFPVTGTTMTAEARLVEVGVIVRGRNQRPVGGLKQTDFEILDNGKKREITSFSAYGAATAEVAVVAAEPGSKAAAPALQSRRRYIGLLFDDLNSRLEEFRPAQAAAERFVKESMAADDRVVVFTTGRGRVYGPADDPQAIIAAIENLRPQARVVNAGTCPRIAPFEAFLIANKLDPLVFEIKLKEVYACKPGVDVWPKGCNPNRPLECDEKDPEVLALFNAIRSRASATWFEVKYTSQVTLDAVRYAAEFLGQQPGSRSLLLASSGFLAGRLEREQEEVINAALRNQVIINSLDAKALYGPDIADASEPGAVSLDAVIVAQSLAGRSQVARNAPLAGLAASTGGKFFQGSNDLGRGFRELEAPEFSYVLGFSPGGQADGKQHKLSVRVTNGGGYTVQARPSYFAAEPEKRAKTVQRKIDKELLGNSKLNDLPLNLTMTSGKLESGATGVQGVLHLNLKEMPFSKQSGMSVQKISFILALLDKQGGFVAGREGTVNLALRETTLNWLSKRGVGIWFELEAPPGVFAARFVATDEKQSRLTASNEVVEIR